MHCYLILATLLSLFAATAHAGPANVVLLPVAGDPAVSYRIMFYAGSQYDPPGKEGLAALTARMIAEGSTKRHHYEEILDLLFPMAGGYEASCSVETVTISGRIHKDNVAAFQPLFMQAILEPAFRSEDFDRIRSDMISYLENTLRYASDEDLGKAVLYETMFAGTPYGHIPAGRVKSLKSITIDDVRHFYDANYSYHKCVIGLGGGYDAGTLTSLNNGLEKLPHGDAPPHPNIDAKPIEGFHVTIVEKDAPATAISIGAAERAPRRARLVSAGPGQLLVRRASQFGQPFIPGHPRGAGAELRRLFLHRAFCQRRGVGVSRARRSAAAADFRDVDPPHAERVAHFALRAALRELKHLVDDGLTEEQVKEKRAALSKYVFHLRPPR